MNIPIPPGVFDIIPKYSKDVWCSSHLWSYLENIIRKTASDYGYLEIRTPMFERTELFQRGVGETSDIVSKEMYTFNDKGNRSMSLRPEGTAPVIRCFIENKLFNESLFHKFFYIAPMFRYERAQAGRYRQHHQFGAEAIGNGSPEQDVELIDLLYTLYQRLGLKNLSLNLNSIGDVESRLAYRNALQNYLKGHFDNLSEDSKNRFETNPLRILDSKDPGDRKVLENVPSILDYLSSESSDHFNEVKKLLDLLKIPYAINSKLVRGLDYYNKTVFEIVAGELGAQNSIGGGGRYDGLVKMLGGPDLPSIGFGTGLERIIQTMLKQQVPVPKEHKPDLFIIALGDKARESAYTQQHELRQNGIYVEMDYTNRKLGKIMQTADQLGAKYVLVIGDNELQTQTGELKKMESGEKINIPFSELQTFLLESEIVTS